MVVFTNEALSRLCSEDRLALLDSIDRLRLQGIKNYVSLHQIIVCGDQSSGKSSSKLCTRFPTELILRRTAHFSSRVSIIPHESRPESEQIALRNFHERKVCHGHHAPWKSIRAGYPPCGGHGADHPHLTIVDLPGLIHAETKHQSSADVELIKGLIQSYMNESRCIILAVFSPKTALPTRWT
ncbi:hypothetical protein N657DRAFT_699176 [Parathielavia appendiculata]|uniref:Dynamin N-terminal domain-containing protein n=1 Tax=Parathielavia appendiculata TaxID=2587402 RepID=A0AAN6TWN5_9PEZI|nr:hypothetical protein N657DRAFT_699176 [Parathielavia appendiculata]